MIFGPKKREGKKTTRLRDLVAEGRLQSGKFILEGVTIWRNWICLVGWLGVVFGTRLLRVSNTGLQVRMRRRGQGVIM
jgi:hypothetical protein